ncbi:hypothetical protein [Rathayibacter agropyri]|uniref:hypothetical protein n=1 Tax=Rathayibacter agropyri TaxID=1634927 RepID=UPI00156781B1|nr:hypothetical protein [Rathayibacter agropyri]NRD10140.1 hypothetical protein [Rathayibacter agropyri]
MSKSSTSAALVAAAAVLVLAGCSAAGGEAPADTPSPSFSFPAAPTATDAASQRFAGTDGTGLDDPATLDGVAAALSGTSAFTFDAGAALSSENAPYWNTDTAALSSAGFPADASSTDPAKGYWTFRNDAGTAILIIQRRLKDSDPQVSDEAATQHAVDVSGPQGDVQHVSLALKGGGTIEALRTALAPAEDGLAWGSVLRSFTQPGIAVQIIATGADQTRADDALDLAVRSTTVGFHGVLPLVGGPTAAPTDR